MRKEREFNNILDECLERVINGETIEQCLASHPEYAAEIEPLLTGPSVTSVHLFRLDPRYDPIRDEPRFQALLEKYEN